MNVRWLRRHRPKVAARRIGTLAVVLALSLCAGVAVSGCGALSAISPVFNEISTDFELGVGQEVARDVETQYQVLDDPLIDFADAAMSADAASRATATGDEQLAGVLAHEIGHVEGRHSMNQLTLALGTQLTIDVLSPGASDYSQAADFVGDLVMLNSSRDDEYDADRRGIVLARAAGYDGDGIIVFLERLLALEREQGVEQDGVSTIFSTHPPTQDRVDRLKQQLADLEAQSI